MEIILRDYTIPVPDFIELALAEDAGDGDHSSLATVSENDSGVAHVRAKEAGIIAGIDVAIEVLHAVDKFFEVEILSRNGNKVIPGDEIITIKGNTRNLLKAERLLLNFMQRMSGIATLTSKFVNRVSGTGAIIIDTRKTTPNFRQFEKAAVLTGGGSNHRYGLYDMIMIKDNHVDAAGGITNALKRAAGYLQRTGKNLSIEIETRNLKEVNEVMNAGIANRVMLDNFNPELLSQAVAIIGNRFETEASGGITLENVRSYGETGVNFISVGAITHSYRSLDISMKISLS
jgi:nicotinate-nucleotide pyrophosphorylase (carboxylating)